MNLDYVLFYTQYNNYVQSDIFINMKNKQNYLTIILLF